MKNYRNNSNDNIDIRIEEYLYIYMFSPSILYCIIDVYIN